MSTFFYLHGDAVGTGLVVLGLAVVVFVLQDRAHIRQQAGQRAAHRALLAKAQREVHDQYKPIIATLLRRRPTYTEDVTQAVNLTRPSPLADTYVFGQTVADVPSPFAPAFYDGQGASR